jgi:hypothetical protein
MIISANSTKRIDETKQIAYFTIIDDSDDEYRFHAVTPILSGADLQSHLVSNIDTYYYNILLKKWPNSDPNRMSGSTPLEKMEAWIDDGHKRLEGYDDEENPIYAVIIEEPFEHTHSGNQSAPEYIDRGLISSTTRDALANAATVEELRTVLSTILLGN